MAEALLLLLGLGIGGAIGAMATLALVEVSHSCMPHDPHHCEQRKRSRG